MGYVPTSPITFRNSHLMDKKLAEFKKMCNDEFISGNWMQDIFRTMMW